MARVFEMVAPLEPGHEVTQVSDIDGDTWWRLPDGTWTTSPGLTGGGATWAELMRDYGPLTDVSPPPPAARTWALPDEPGPEVLRLSQAREDGVRRWERTASGNWRTLGGLLSSHWSQVLALGPVTDATGEVWS